MGYFNLSEQEAGYDINGTYDTVRDTLTVELYMGGWYELMKEVSVSVYAPDIGKDDDVSRHLGAIKKLIRMGESYRDFSDIRFSMMNVFDDVYRVRVIDINGVMGDDVIVDEIRLEDDEKIHRIIDAYAKAFYLDVEIRL